MCRFSCGLNFPHVPKAGVFILSYHPARYKTEGEGRVVKFKHCLAVKQQKMESISLIEASWIPGPRVCVLPSE